MNLATLEEAKKKLRTEKPKEPFMVIQINDDDKLILPHSAGVELMKCLVNAEQYNERWVGGNTRIISVRNGYIKTETLSYQEYEIFKLAALLNCSRDDVREAQEQAAQRTNTP